MRFQEQLIVRRKTPAANGIAQSNEIIGLARYDVDPATLLADVGIVVRDDWQRRGVGGELMSVLRDVAFAQGLAGFHADVLAPSKPMLTLLTQTGLDITSRSTDALIYVDALFNGAKPVRA